MDFRILGHACLEATHRGTTLLCDPWLVGSAYWRSWWNYPPVPPRLVESLDPDFIYLTHLHWDHFHSATLKRLGRERTILVPKTPDTRIRDDLVKLGFHRIIELSHGRPFRLGDDFTITSYQFNWFADSALVIEAGDVVLLNCNDAKLMGLPLKQVIARHPKIDFVLRSHSSANARVCYEISDQGNIHIDQPEKYSLEFADFARSVGARYAIPFASNHCYLHEDSYRFNSYTNYAPKVKTYFDANGITSPECVIMAPGDGWSQPAGFNISARDWYKNIEEAIDEYREAKRDSLEKTRALESRVRLKPALVERYAHALAEKVPWIVRRYFKGHPITLMLKDRDGWKGLLVDVWRGRIAFVDSWNDEDNPIQIHTLARIFHECITRNNWNSLSISKRLRIRVRRRDAKYVEAFIFLNKCFDYHLFPLSRCLNRRFFRVWVARWRELALYAGIALNLLLLKRGFQYRDYLPTPRATRNVDT